MDLARSIQEVVEEVVIRMARHVKTETGERHLCMAGGVSLNCVANGKLLRSGLYEDLWIQPASGDAGGALGAALVAQHHYLGGPAPQKRGRDFQGGSYFGPSYDNQSVKRILDYHNIPYDYMETEELLYEVAGLIAGGKVVGWFQGRMEFGPRALGNRSILGDARSPEMQKRINLKIKFRESFRPFAPSVLAERVGEWFDLDRESPYMLLVADVREEKRRAMTEQEQKLWGIDKLNVARSEIPAVTHVDYSARIQTVSREDNPLYHALIEKFCQRTGCPVIVNTSFNVRGEPIVQSPMDAYRCFMRTEMDVLAMGNFLLHKEGQPEFRDEIDWRKLYEPD
jgi:carbamoyltransferase